MVQTVWKAAAGPNPPRRGPCATLVRALRRVGWQPLHPASWADHRGREVTPQDRDLVPRLLNARRAAGAAALAHRRRHMRGTHIMVI